MSVINRNQAAGDGAINACSLVKRYPGAADPALDHLELQVRAGEFYGLLGPNGAGKSTLIALLSGLLRADSGTIDIMGVDPAQQLPALKPLIGLVPQEIALYDGLTAAENLSFFAAMQGLNGPIRRDRVARCLHFVHLTKHADHRVATFSGGMKRRLNLAAGLLGEPRLLLLDEPTVGIDVQSRALIYEKLLELNAHGTTIFYTTHYLEEARDLCRRLGIIDHGRLIDEGPPESLLQRYRAATLDELMLRLAGSRPRD